MDKVQSPVVDNTLLNFVVFGSILLAHRCFMLRVIVLVLRFIAPSIKLTYTLNWWDIQLDISNISLKYDLKPQSIKLSIKKYGLNLSLSSCPDTGLWTSWTGWLCWGEQHLSPCLSTLITRDPPSTEVSCGLISMCYYQEVNSLDIMHNRQAIHIDV